jgi:hypothetical protein
MSINLYPAHIKGREVIYADEEVFINLANANFFSLAKSLGLREMQTGIGTIRVKHLRMALATSLDIGYTKRLNQLCAQAEILKAPFIAFS